MNFKNENGKYSNECHKQGGSCCTSECKYINDGQEIDKNGNIHKWFACSDSCIKSNCKITCRNCKHKPNYMIFEED